MSEIFTLKHQHSHPAPPAPPPQCVQVCVQEETYLCLISRFLERRNSTVSEGREKERTKERSECFIPQLFIKVLIKDPRTSLQLTVSHTLILSHLRGRLITMHPQSERALFSFLSALFKGLQVPCLSTQPQGLIHFHYITF